MTPDELKTVKEIVIAIKALTAAVEAQTQIVTSALVIAMSPDVMEAHDLRNAANEHLREGLGVRG